jgi:hypothetical protein
MPHWMIADQRIFFLLDFVSKDPPYLEKAHIKTCYVTTAKCQLVINRTQWS